MEYDYIIVGAGSAGCVLAARLSENPANRVLLLEAGGRDRHPLIHMPAGLARLATMTSVNWSYYTQAEPELYNRRLYWPRGKVLGGSSSINAMCYCRGHARDYDGWAESGCTGWHWEAVKPWFLRSEDQQRGASEFHGAGGELKVQDLRYHSPLSERFIEAGVQAGYTRTEDFNGPRQRGFGLYQVTQDNGRRCSTAYAFLRPALQRPNLTVMTHAQVRSVRIDNGRALGVVASVNGKVSTFEAGETVLAGGAINSPQILMLSGIGRPDDLSQAGVEPLHDLPGVGQNLQDHLDICTLVGIKGKDSYDHINEVLAGLRYLLTRGGPGSSNVAEAGAFVASDLSPDERPDIQLHFVPALLDDHGRNRMDGYGMTIHACNLRPSSRGEIRLSSRNPDEAPLIFARYMSTEFDRRMMIECARLGRRIFEQPAFAEIRSGEILPGSQHQGDEALLDFVRRKAETIYHPVGTCKMGSDPMSVVDPQLRVQGIDGLRVCDASVIPALVSGNTNAPTIMIAERCAAWMLDQSAPIQSVTTAAA